MAQILSSWKEIAQYLGKGVRTVQRWEQFAGLPVKRPAAGQHNIVLAYTDEIDAWLAHGGEAGENARLRAENTELLARIKELEQQLARISRRTPVVAAHGSDFRHENWDTLRVRTSELHQALSETFRLAEELRTHRAVWNIEANPQANTEGLKH